MHHWLRSGRCQHSSTDRDTCPGNGHVPAGIFFSSDGFDDVFAVEDTDQAVDAGGIVQQFGFVALDQATGDDNALAVAGVFQVRSLR